MYRLFRYLLVGAMLSWAAGTMMAQTTNWQAIHEVKKKETVFGIAQNYGITMEQLRVANPQLLQPGYQLKKGEKLYIPFAAKPLATGPQETVGVASRPIRLGVMLPLHDVNGDGRRMVEYYRGVLMACDSLKKIGLSVDVRAWNVPEDADIAKTLEDPAAAKLDMIIGPLYSKQMPALSDFVSRHGIPLVIPFSINAPQLQSNPYIFQIYQSQDQIDEATVRRACSWFKDYHPIIIDCGDAQSTKGNFTASLRKGFEQRGVQYSLTSLTSATNQFVNAFDTKKRNVVILNSSRTSCLEAALGKLGVVASLKPEAAISMLGYNDWLLQVPKHGDYFHTFDVYIPSVYYANPQASATLRLQQKYRWNFHQDMLPVLPNFALTGFDHAYFFLRGLNKYGKAFDGAGGRLTGDPVQTPLKFQRQGNGGHLNRGYMFVHFKNDRQVEMINY